MRRDGLWHPRLLEIIARIGHTETLVLADAGLPVPPHVEVIDLVWSRSEPPLLPVLRCVLAEMPTERATLADELGDGAMSRAFGRELAGIATDRVGHEELKELTGRARVVVRTGECTPYANVLLHAGVAFGQEVDDAAG
jgi:D-ribose pyranase